MQIEPAVQMDDFVFRFQQKGKRNILDHTSLEIASGQITLLMGGSGCGKSTLAAVAAGLYPENGGYLESGSVRLFGVPLDKMNEQERAGLLSMMFQNPDLQFCMNTLRKEMRFCLENIRVPAAEMDDRIQNAAEQLGVAALLDRTFHTLSGGEKQKAALACLYVLESRCILLDECFANIDRDAAAELITMLEKLRQQGRTVIAIDHRADLWLEVADEIILLGEGCRIEARGIRKENLAEFYDIFKRCGVYYPGEALHPHKALQGGSVFLSFRDLSIFPGNRTRKKGKKEPEADALLEHAEADFRCGTMTAVLGPSGCGKTSTFLAVLKQHPYSGTIMIDGQDLSEYRARELYQKIGIVFQNPANQFITQNVEEEVLASIQIWNPELSETERRRRADKLLEFFQLGRFRKYSPYMLSQGQQRRLAVLSVLACGQEALLLDEPTYGQDARSTESIMQLLRRKVEEDHLTVIFITHDRMLASVYADRIYAVQDRKLVLLSVRGSADEA